MADAGLVEQFDVPVQGRRRPDRRWRITPAGLAKLDGFAAGAPEPAHPHPEGTGEWHRVDEFAYSVSCHPAGLPGWALFWDEGNGGGILEALIVAVVFAMIRRRHNGPPWAVTVRRIRRFRWRPVVVYRAEYDDLDAAGAATAALDRQLRAGRLPATVGSAAAPPPAR